MEHTFEKDGVRMNGNFIKYDTDLADIKPSVIESLSSQTATGWSVFLIHRAIVDLKEEVNKHLICPINPESIKRLSRDVAIEEIKKQPAKAWGKAISIIKDVIIILTIVTLIVALLNK